MVEAIKPKAPKKYCLFFDVKNETWIPKSKINSINIKLDKIAERLEQSAVNQAQIKTDIEYIKKAVIIVQDEK